MPESAELVAAMAGTRPAWITTQQTSATLFGHGATGGGSRTRAEEPIVHPTRVKQLLTGQAVVVAPGSDQAPVVAQVHHPREALELAEPGAGALEAVPGWALAVRWLRRAGGSSA